MKHARRLTAALCLLTATGCSTLHELAPPLTPPANLTAPCPELEAAPVADLGELLGVCMDDAMLYRECAARHRALAEWAAGR